MSFFTDDDGDPTTSSFFDSPIDRFSYGGLAALSAANAANKDAERRNKEQLKKLEKIAETEGQRLELEKERLALEKEHRENEERALEALVTLRRRIVEINMELNKIRSDLHESSCDLFSPMAGRVAFIGTHIEFLEKEKGQLVEISDIESAENLICSYQDVCAFFSSNSELRRDPLDYGREVGRCIATIQDSFALIAKVTNQFSLMNVTTGLRWPEALEAFKQIEPEAVPILTKKIVELIKENHLGLPYGSAWMAELYISEHGSFPDWADGTSETIKTNIENILEDSLGELSKAKSAAQKRWTDEMRAIEIEKENQHEIATDQFHKAISLFDKARSNLSLEIHRKACAAYKKAVVASDACGNFRSDGGFVRLKKRAVESKLRADARFRGVRFGAIIGGTILTLFLIIYFTLEAGRR